LRELLPVRFQGFQERVLVLEVWKTNPGKDEPRFVVGDYFAGQDSLQRAKGFELKDCSGKKAWIDFLGPRLSPRPEIARASPTEAGAHLYESA
jgi:hypothetical protein